MKKTNELREALANHFHDQWSNWMKYLFSKSVENVNDGSVLIPAELVERWKRQANTLYEELSEDEQNSARREADKFMQVIEELEKTKSFKEGKVLSFWRNLACDLDLHRFTMWQTKAGGQVRACTECNFIEYREWR